MIHQRKKDYLQRLIEEFFAKLHKLRDEDISLLDGEKLELIENGLEFFRSELDVTSADNTKSLLEKIADVDLVEQYARLLSVEFQTNDARYAGNLLKALSLLDYLQEYDKTYSWERTILREDILRMIEENRNI